MKTKFYEIWKILKKFYYKETKSVENTLLCTVPLWKCNSQYFWIVRTAVILWKAMIAHLGECYNKDL